MQNAEVLIKETKRVFAIFPKTQPSAYNGNSVYSKFTLTVAIPLKSSTEIESEALAKAEILLNTKSRRTELDSIVYKNIII